MIPIRDHNPTHTTPHLTIGLIIVNILVFLMELIGPGGIDRAAWKYGFVPAELVRSRTVLREEMQKSAQIVQMRDQFGRVVPVRIAPPIEEVEAIPAWMNIFTCMYLHGGWMHLIGNMIYLWIFGNNIEDRLGPVLYFVFYTATGLVGNLLHTFFDPSAVPLVGASGAISGILGAYILLYPHERITAIVPIGYYPATVNLPAWIFLGIYIVIQNLFPATFGAGTGGGGGVAYWAHIGGFAAGAALIKLMPLRPRPTRVGPVYVDDDADFVL